MVKIQCLNLGRMSNNGIDVCKKVQVVNISTYDFFLALHGR